MVINSIGVHIPDTHVDNYKIAATFGKSSEFIDQKIGFRRLAEARKESVTDMLLAAYADLAEKTAIDPKEIGLIITVVQTPERRIPHTSAVIHNKIGCTANCMTFDVNQACAGYCYALSIAEKMNIDNTLILTGEKFSSIISREDLDFAMLLGDAATATLLKCSGSGFSITDSFCVTEPDSCEAIKMSEGFLHMSGQDVFRSACKIVPSDVMRILSRNGKTIDDAELILLHQASLKIVSFIGKLLKAPEKVPFLSGDYGNTGQSSIPLMLAEYIDRSDVKTVVACGFGAGFSHGTVLLEK